MDRRKRNKRKLLLLTALGLTLAAVVFVRLQVSPLIRELAKARVANRASYIINEATEAQMEQEDIHYDRIVFLEKDIKCTRSSFSRSFFTSSTVLSFEPSLISKISISL